MTAAPAPYFDSAGRQIGQFRTMVTQVGTREVVLAVAAMPSFADPQARDSVEAWIERVPEFSLAPRPGAISISGPLNGPTFPGLGDTLLIDGGDEGPAISVTDPGAYTALMEEFGDGLFHGYIDGTELVGGDAFPYTDYEHGLAGTINLPVLQLEQEFFTSAQMNTYRNALRTQILGVADNYADRVITSSVTGDQLWGDV